MHRVGVSEARRHLSRLLDQVVKGGRIAIERHGVPMATLQPVDASKREPVGEIIAKLKQFRTGHRLGRLSVREVIEEGRR
jgi:prevent-host-death family protein